MNYQAIQPQQLIEEAARNNLSSFDGLPDEMLGFDGSSSYIGENDPFVDFGGITKSFADPINKGRIYVLNIQNLDVDDALSCIIIPGLILFNKPPLGLVKEGVFADANNINAAGLTASGTPEKIEYFQAYIQQFPTTVLGLKISSDNALQIEQSILIEKQSPFKKLESRNVYPSAHTDETANKDKVATVAEQFELDSETKISYLLLPATKVTLTFFCGASLSQPKALREKQTRAGTNIRRLGGPMAVTQSRLVKRGR